VGLLALAQVIAASTATTTARDLTAGDFMTAYPRFRADRNLRAAADQPELFALALALCQPAVHEAVTAVTKKRYAASRVNR
jgi:hypothetical protein